MMCECLPQSFDSQRRPRLLVNLESNDRIGSVHWRINKWLTLFCLISKWTMLTLARLLLTHASYNSSSRKSHIDEARRHFQELGRLDPKHGEYYQHQSSLLSLKEVFGFDV